MMLLLTSEQLLSLTLFVDLFVMLLGTMYRQEQVMLIPFKLIDILGFCYMGLNK